MRSRSLVRVERFQIEKAEVLVVLRRDVFVSV